MYTFTGKIYLPNAISTQTHMLNQYIATSDYLMKHNLLRISLLFSIFNQYSITYNITKNEASGPVPEAKLGMIKPFCFCAN